MKKDLFQILLFVVAEKKKNAKSDAKKGKERICNY